MEELKKALEELQFKRHSLQQELEQTENMIWYIRGKLSMTEETDDNKYKPINVSG